MLITLDDKPMTITNKNPQRNLSGTLAQLEVSGFGSYAAELLSELSKPVVIPYEYTINFDNHIQVKRLQRLLYQLLWFHPDKKSKVSLKADELFLTIRISDKTERRGRRGSKKV